MIAQKQRRTLELCAGSGGLSYALWKQGFNATGVDWLGNRHATKIPLILRDLTDPAQQKEVEELREGIDYLHMAPPCGTASAARGYGVSEEDKAKGAPEPVPLRSKQHPWGLPGLSEYNKMKVEKANAIYVFCISMIVWCCEHKPSIPFTLENPSRSWLWEIPPMKEVMKKFNLTLLHTHMCMHGLMQIQLIPHACGRAYVAARW